MTVPAPTAVRQAAALVLLEGAVGLAAAAVLVVRGFLGADQRIVSGFGTAVWFAVVGGAVFAAGWALWSGRRWGRGIAVFAQLLLLPVTWYVAVGSHQWFYGIPVALIALAALLLLFSPSALQWLAFETTQDTTQDAASADNSGPDTR
jgi:peptidoglycan/LPS O-acetylase OafA/YrhL